VRNEDVNTAEVGFDVVAAPVEVADKVDENEKVAEAGAESGEANVEKEKSDYMCQSIWSGKGPTVRGFYKERAAAASAQEKWRYRTEIIAAFMKKCSRLKCPFCRKAT
jgi:4-diphosphocytidyl-2C-methyl-D-erythritol kinase